MDYLDILNSKFYKDTYTEIEELKKDFPVNHGFVHISNVLENSKGLAELFILNDEQKKLLFIACLLHDIGYLKGRENHAMNGSVLAKEYLTNSDLKENEIEIICNAIANHGAKKKEDLEEPVSMCLALSDKLDFAKKRYKDDISKYPKIEPYLNILETNLAIKNGDIVLSIIINEQFSLESLKDDYFNIKLNNLLELLSQVKKINCKIEYIVKTSK